MNLKHRISYKTVSKITLSVAFVMSTFCAVGTELSVGYDTKYVSEGRNNLDDGGIVWGTLNTDINEQVSFSTVYGYATSSNTDYDELNVGIQYASSVESIDFYVGYTYLAFLKDDADDNEVSFGASWQNFDSFSPFIDFVYSTEASGSFVQLGIQTEAEATTSLSINPYLILAYDFGYASESHDGYNHAAVGVNANYAIDSAFSVRLSVEQTFGGSDVRGERGQSDQFWAGMHLNYAY